MRQAIKYAWETKGHLATVVATIDMGLPDTDVYDELLPSDVRRWLVAWHPIVRGQVVLSVGEPGAQPPPATQAERCTLPVACLECTGGQAAQT